MSGREEELTEGIGWGLDGCEVIGADYFDEFTLEEGVAMSGFVSIGCKGMV